MKEKTYRRLFLLPAFVLVIMAAKIAAQTRSEPELLCFCMGIVTASIVVCAAFLAFFLRGGKHPEKAFPLLALGLGILYLFAITPISVPDESAHYRAAYELSNRLTLQDNPGEANGADFDFTDFPSHNNSSLGYRRIVSDFFSASRYEDPVRIEVLSSLQTLYIFAEYLPQAIGIVTARFFDLNFLQTFYLGRFANLLFYVLCLSAAIKKVPFFKTTFGLIGTLPMALQQAASFSYDSYINGLAFLLIACMLKACYDAGPLSRRDYLSLLVCSILLAPAKGAYTLLVLLYLLIPAERFPSKKRKWFSFLGILLGCCLILLITVYPAMVRILGSSAEKYNAVSVHELFSAEALRFVERLYNTLNKLLTDWIEAALGRLLSGLTLEVPGWMIWIELSILILSVLKIDGSEVSVTEKMRAVFLLLSALVLISFILTMYFTVSDKTWAYILGVQGRYFLPVLPLLLLSLNNRTLVLKRNIDREIVTIHAITSACVLIYIVDFTTAV